MNGGLLKLTVHFGERDRVAGELLADRLLDDFERHGIAASALLRGIDGFGLRHHLRTDRLLTLSEDLPVTAVALDEPEKVRAVVEELPGPAGTGLIAMRPAAPAAPGGTGDLRLVVFLGRRQRLGGDLAFVGVCELLRRHGVGGATALLAVDGTVGGERRRARFFSGNDDVPTVIVAVGPAPAVAAAAAELVGAAAPAALAAEPLRVCKRDGDLLARPTGEGWQRLDVYSSESALVEGHAIHHQLVRRLRRAGARGATAIRGIWGFHGDHAPHGDRLLQLRRRAPVITSVIDEGARIEEWFGIVDGLTHEHGLVTCEPVERLALQAAAS